MYRHLREKKCPNKQSTHDQRWQQIENKYLWRTCYVPDSVLGTGTRR